MNWEKIREKYPKAWDLLIINHATHNAWGEIDSPEVWDISKITSWELRHLYDFFDEQGIIIEIKWYKTDFRYNIWFNDYVRNAQHRKTRTEAEEQAFLKAFEILEEKLSSPETPGS